MTKPYWQQRQELKLKATSGMTPLEQKKPKIGLKSAQINVTEPVKGGAKKAKKKKAGRTKKLARIMRALKKTYPAFLERYPICRIQSPECTQVATVVNHEKGRGITVVMNQKYWTPCCPACNGYIEIHNQWAVDRGFKKSRHAIEGPEENNSENIC